MHNILFISGLAGDTRRYRCHHHQEQLALHGISSILCEADDFQIYVEAAACDVIIFHRLPYSDLVADVLEIAHLRAAPVVFETDDLIFEPDLYDSIAYLDTLPPDAAQRFRQDLHAQVKTFAASDFVLTTTAYLAAAAERRGKRAFVQRNACSAKMLEVAAAAHATRRDADAQPSDEVVIGYFSGTGSHNRDFATITPALLTIMERYPHVWLHVSGHLTLDDRFQAFGARIRRAPLVPWQELAQLIAQVDINLAPLELDNAFCQAKSEIKYSEAALVGVPTIASPTEAFAYAIENGANGLLAATQEEWEAALARLIEDPVERQRLGEAARQRVYAEYAPEPRSQELLATLHEIEANYQSHAATPDQLAVVVAAAMKRQLDRLALQQQEQARQMEQLRVALNSWQAQPDDRQRDFWRRSYEQADSHYAEALRSILTRLQNPAAHGT